MTKARVLIVVVAVALLAAGRVEAPSHMAVPGAEDDVPALDAAAATFPLSVAPDQRHLQDAKGKPFLIHGEAAWSLIAQLTREQAETYLDDRRRRGFNTLLVELLEHRFATNAPANVYGAPPFLANGDYSVPNEAYFAHADWVLRRAAERGFLVVLAPSFMGAGGGPEGWYREMVANGAEKLRQYGRYLGRRYRGFDNIIWLHAGDFDPPEKTLASAIAEGIQEVDPASLHTAHGAPETTALDYWRGEPWLKVNTLYTYGSVFAAAAAQYARPDHMPFFLLESAYENEHGITPQRLRAQAYQAVLSGAAGQIFGNNPIWHFDGPGLYRAPVTWQQALGSEGTRSMSHLRQLLESRPWWRLEPDLTSDFLTEGIKSDADRAVAARATDGSFALVYVPTRRRIAIDLRRFAGPRVAATWFDPSTGANRPIEGSPFATATVQTISRAPGRNGAGFGDWVLIIDAMPD